jgi:hypothetical protein
MTMNNPHTDEPLLIRWKVDAPGPYNNKRGHDTTTTTTRETTKKDAHEH